MGKIIDAVLSPLAFSRYPVSILVALLYGLVFSSVLLSDSLPKVKYSKGFDQALTDLTKITARPHPYLSHANDHVRSYLLSRIKSIDSDIEVIDDLNSTVVYSRPGAGVYFEGTNILVKVPGSSKHDSNAVLFSAHYDSVSSAPGATDNGIGAVAALHFLEYLADMPRNERPRRTAIFNINNNEEDGLHGAHAFMIHPWAKLTTTFLNLDGAGAGGRPMLFRTTALSPTEAFLKGQPTTGYSHANVISQDGFGRGVIKSGTDWQVYKDTMDGVDLAFYKNRALYHTKFDSLTYAEGGRRSLQAMMEAVRYGGLEMLDAPVTSRQGRKDAVYFDVLGKYNYIWEMNTVFVINVVFLVVFPVFLVSCLVIYLFIASGIGTGWLVREDISVLKKIWRATKVCLGVSQFAIALATVALLETALVLGFLKFNLYVVHSQAPLVFVSTLSLAYISVALPITLIKSAGITSTRSKNISIISLYIFTWVLLVVYTSVLRGQKIGGLYWATIWNFFAFLSVLFTFAQSLAGLSYRGQSASVCEEVTSDVDDGVQSTSSPTRKYVRGIEHVPGSGRALAETGDEDDRGDEDDGVTRETEPTEITPLMHQHRRYGPDGRVVVDAVDDPECPTSQIPPGDETTWWVAQMILGVPIPALLVYEIAVLLLGALPQTLVDGSSAKTVYGALALLSTLIVLPIAPFVHKTHGRLNFLVTVIFVATTLYCFLTHPFTQVAPMKVRFVQNVHIGKQTILPLTEQSSNPGLAHTPTPEPQYKDEVLSATTSLLGLSKHVEKVVSELPSSHGQDITCQRTSIGLTNCTWSVDEEWVPSPGGKNSNDWVTGDIERVDGKTSQATIHVRGANSRGCRIYFDQPIYDYKVRAYDGDHWDGIQQDGYGVPPEGTNLLFLWSRTWDRNFEVRVTFGPEGVDPAPSLSGKLACEYSEYLSGIAGAGGGRGLENGGRIPAFEETLRFLPKWAVVTKAADGLVEVWRSFSL